jgi:UDP-N-acetylglucosamine--N-acetylmuramyl-(pentapeptide) pyrophosphoryl-undecaprenol N-acetylglucosamine transferase
MTPLRVVIAGGGTGGHLYPGISVAREIRRRYPDAIVTFAGTSRGIESRVVPREGFELDVLRSAGVKAVSPAALTRAISLLPLSAVDAWRILSRRKPDVVIGVGGYSSGPVMLLAALRRMPTLLLEQNAVPGLTNRILAPTVAAAAITFESTASYFGRRAFVAGNPVRPEFFRAQHREVSHGEPGESGHSEHGEISHGEHGSGRTAAQSEPPRILIFGGSQGAHAINMAMVEAAPRLAAHPGGLAITHQTGERDLERVREGYRRAHLEARVEPFLFTMDREMTTADVVICRAGATTIAELMAAGRPSLLVPLPTAADDHQRKNAEAVAAAGAAEMLEQAQMTGDRLAERIIALASDPARRTAMSEAARRLAKPDAARVIVDRVVELWNRH